MVQESRLPEDFYSLPFGRVVATCLAALDVEDDFRERRSGAYCRLRPATLVAEPLGFFLASLFISLFLDVALGLCL